MKELQNLKSFQARDKKAELVKEQALLHGLTFINEAIDTENNDKRLTFKYRSATILISVRATCQRFVVQAIGPSTELMFVPLTETFTKTADGIRIGNKGQRYPSTLEHAIDQIRIFKQHIDLRTK